MIGRKLIRYDEVESTNDVAKALAEAGAEHGTAIIARRQTGGRGRRGRPWVSLPGEQLYLSLVLRPSLPGDRVFELTMVAAVALADALEDCGLKPGIKWPNDIEVGGRKIAGILCESACDDAGRIRYVIVGVGVNGDAAPEDFPAELRDRATSFYAVTGRKGQMASVATAFFAQMEEWVRRHESDGFDAVLVEWRGRSTTLGTRVVAQVDGSAVVGFAQDVDSSGALLIRDDSRNVHRLVGGEVETLRPV